MDIDRLRIIMPDDEADLGITREEVIADQKKRRRLTQRAGRAGQASFPLIVLATCIGAGTVGAVAAKAVEFRPTKITETSEVGQDFRLDMLQVVLDPQNNATILNSSTMFGYKSTEPVSQAGLVAAGHLRGNFELLARGNVAELKGWVQQRYSRAIDEAISAGSSTDQLLTDQYEMLAMIDGYREKCQKEDWPNCSNFGQFLSDLEKYGLYPYIRQNIVRADEQNRIAHE